MSKKQTSLLSFFDKQDKNIETTCLGCGKLFPSSKIQWHKDFNCDIFQNSYKNKNNIAQTNSKKSKYMKKKTKMKPKRKIPYSQDSPEVCILLSDSDSDIDIYSDADDKSLSSVSGNRPESPALFDLDQSDSTPLSVRDRKSAKDSSLLKNLMKDWKTPESTPVKQEIQEFKLPKDVCKQSITIKSENIYDKPVILDKASEKLKLINYNNDNAIVSCDNQSQTSKDILKLELKENLTTKMRMEENLNIPIQKFQLENHKNVSNLSSKHTLKLEVKENINLEVKEEENSNSPPKKLKSEKSKNSHNLSGYNSDFSLISDTNSEDEFEDINVAFCTPNLRRNELTNKKSRNFSNSREDKISKSSHMEITLSSTQRFQNVSTFVKNFEEESANISVYSESTPLNTPRLVSPERTPTPSPDTSSSGLKAKTIGLSKHIISSPHKFNLKTSLNSNDISVNAHIRSCTKKTSTELIKSVQKTNTQTGLISPTLENVCRNLYHSPDLYHSPLSSQKSPSRFRGVKGMYLENFLVIIEIVMSHTEDVLLFNNEDLKAIKGFYQLSLEAQKLYVRLFQRTLKWSRVSKLKYKDICDQDDFQMYINELVYAGYLLSEESLTNLREMLSLLEVNEIRQIAKAMNMTASGNKNQLIERLIKFEHQQISILTSFTKITSESKILKLAREILGKCYLLCRDIWEVFMRVLLLYSPCTYSEDEESGHQNQLLGLLLASMGKMIYPEYRVSRELSLFRSRDDLICFQKSLHLEFEIQECINKKDWEEAVSLCKQAEEVEKEVSEDQNVLDHDLSLPPFLRRFTTMSLLYYIRTLSVECYQRLRKYGCAVKQLEYLLAQKTHLQDYRGRWFERLAINLGHLKNNKKALAAIKAALEDPEVRVGHRLTLSQKAEKLLSAKAIPKSIEEFKDQLEFMTYEEAPKVFIEGKSISSGIPGYKNVFLIHNDLEEEQVICSVEELVLNHYKKEGYPKGLHAEGRTVSSLFGVFLWDVLYMPVEDVFRSSHQAVPLDLDSPHFYLSRKAHIDKRLAKMENWSLGRANKEAEKIWKNENKMSPVDWKLFSSLEFFQGLVAGLGMKLITAICRRLALDHRFTRSGFPDLIVWNPEEQVSRIVEVKGPNDRLSTKQILWLDYLLQHGAAAEVCHINAAGLKMKEELKTQRKSSRKRKSSNEAFQETSKPADGKGQDARKPSNKEGKETKGTSRLKKRKK